MAPVAQLPDWLKEAKPGLCVKGFAGVTGGRVKHGFVEKTLANLSSFLTAALYGGNAAAKQGLLQGITPHARISGMVILVAASAMTQVAVMLGFIAALAAVLTLTSGVAFKSAAKRVAPSFVFTLVLMLPVVFSFMTPGAEVAGIKSLGIAVTKEGIYSAAFFLTRVTTAVWLASLLSLTTTQNDFFKGLRRLPVPAFFVTALFMTFRYMFILVKIAEDAALARRSRVMRPFPVSESQRWFASRATLILKRSVALAEEVSMAMASRGFKDTIKGFDGKRLSGRDFPWLGLTVFVLLLSVRF